MLKKHAGLLLLLTGNAALSAYLLMKASLVGRVGIDLVYKEYQFLKTGWQSFLYILLVYGLLVFLLNRFSQGGKNRLLLPALVILALGVAGAVYTYQDFRHTLSHRLLGGRFHLGAYLFWAGWLIIPLYFIWRPNERKASPAARPDAGRY